MEEIFMRLQQNKAWQGEFRAGLVFFWNGFSKLITTQNSKAISLSKKLNFQFVLLI